MCGCVWGYVCVGCRDTRHDPAYFDVDDTPQDEPERERPLAHEVEE